MSENKTTTSRRAFLQKSSMFALGSMAIPTIMKSGVLGLNGAISPNNKITLGYIGVGNKAQRHIGFYVSNPAIQSLYICDVDRARLEKTHKVFKQQDQGDVKKVEHYEEVINDPSVDAVLIATPDHWHVSIAIAAMSQGKDVYVEKPVSLTIEEGKAIAEAEKRYGRIVQVGSQQRSDSTFHRAATLVRNGYIGEVKEIYVKLGSFPQPKLGEIEKIPEGFNYDKWLGQAPYEPYFKDRVRGIWNGGWRCFWEYGSRKNGDWGAHHFDIIQWALGMDDSGPTHFVPKGYNGEKYSYYTYDTGVKVIRDHPKSREMITFVGTEGTVEVSRAGILKTSNSRLRNISFKLSDENLYVSRDHGQNWIDSMYSRKQTICPAAVGHRTASVCQLLGIAERLQRPVRWDPKIEQILGDEEAKRWMSRPRRAGYELPV